MYFTCTAYFRLRTIHSNKRLKKSSKNVSPKNVYSAYRDKAIIKNLTVWCLIFKIHLLDSPFSTLYWTNVWYPFLIALFIRFPIDELKLVFISRINLVSNLTNRGWSFSSAPLTILLRILGRIFIRTLQISISTNGPDS